MTIIKGVHRRKSHGGRLLFFPGGAFGRLIGAESPQHDVEDRCQEQAENRHAEHAAENRPPQRLPHFAAAGQRALDTAVFGGMIASTLLAVFFVPVFYVLFQRLGEWRKKGPENVENSQDPA